MTIILVTFLNTSPKLDSLEEATMELVECEEEVIKLRKKKWSSKVKAMIPPKETDPCTQFKEVSVITTWVDKPIDLCQIDLGQVLAKVEIITQL